MGMDAWECHGSRGPETAVTGGRPWRYMHGDAMKVGTLRGQSQEGGHGDICVGMPWR